MTGLGLPVLLVVFAVAAGLIWVAGVQLSTPTDVLATRLHLGSALGGLILLASRPTCRRSPSPSAPR